MIATVNPSITKGIPDTPVAALFYSHYADREKGMRGGAGGVPRSAEWTAAGDDPSLGRDQGQPSEPGAQGRRSKKMYPFHEWNMKN